MVTAGFARTASGSGTSSRTAFGRGARIMEPHTGQGPSTPAAAAGSVRFVPQDGQANLRRSFSMVSRSSLSAVHLRKLKHHRGTVELSKLFLGFTVYGLRGIPPWPTASPRRSGPLPDPRRTF